MPPYLGSTIERTALTMRGDGTVLVREIGNSVPSETGLYYISPDGSRKFVPGLGAENYFIIGNKFYTYGPTHAADGVHIYELEVEQDPFGIVYPSYDPSSQIFSFRFIPGATGDYELQRSTNFVEWTQIVTITANSDAVRSGIWVQSTNTPGCFRLHKL